MKNNEMTEYWKDNYGYCMITPVYDNTGTDIIHYVVHFKNFVKTVNTYLEARTTLYKHRPKATIMKNEALYNR